MRSLLAATKIRSLIGELTEAAGRYGFSYADLRNHAFSGAKTMKIRFVLAGNEDYHRDVEADWVPAIGESVELQGFGDGEQSGRLVEDVHHLYGTGDDEKPLHSVVVVLGD